MYLYSFIGLCKLCFVTYFLCRLIYVLCDMCLSHLNKVYLFTPIRRWDDKRTYIFCIYCIYPVAVGVQFGYLVATINTRCHKDRKNLATFFTKRLRGLKHLSYSDRLNKFKFSLPSLELRRLHLDLVYRYCYKIFLTNSIFSCSHKRAFVQTV